MNDEKKMEELKNCPCCGGRPVVWHPDDDLDSNDSYYTIFCHDCHLSLKTSLYGNQKTLADIILAWNKRTPELFQGVVPNQSMDEGDGSAAARDFHPLE